MGIPRNEITGVERSESYPIIKRLQAALEQADTFDIDIREQFYTEVVILMEEAIYNSRIKSGRL
jgi:hypothetical protein